MIVRPALFVAVIAALLGCGPRSSVTVSAGPVPSTPQPQQRSITLYEAPAARPAASTSIEDEGDVEPARPLGVKLPERAVVHVHGRSSCSGVLVTPALCPFSELHDEAFEPQGLAQTY